MSINILVPEMGESIVDARVARWFKKAGEAVNVGDPLVELETDKVDVEVAAPQTGVLASITHGDGDDVKIGDVLGTIAQGTSTEFAPASAGAAARAGARASGASAPAPATPSARKLAREEDVAIDTVKAAGPRVRKADVTRTLEAFSAAARTRLRSSSFGEAGPALSISAPSTKAPSTSTSTSTSTRAQVPVPVPALETRSRMSKRRATIARRLVEVQQTAAMLTTFNEVDMSAVMALRDRHKQAFKEKHGVGLGIASFFVKATVIALGEFPRLNAEIRGDEIVLKHYYDIGVAVGAAEGLVVPVLRAADRLSFAAVELGIRAFATKARDGSLSLDDIRGGTFTITNGGVFGSLMSTPILNPPQVGILGLHAIKERPIGVAGQIVLRPMMYTALTYDHRIVDGAEAVQFLVRVKDLVEDPAMLLIES